MSGKTYLFPWDAETKKLYLGTGTEDVEIKKVYSFPGDHEVYSSGHVVSYHIDTDNVVEQEVDDGADCISNAPSVSVPGYTLHGWREDTTASATVLESKECDDEGIVLYAVLKKTISVTYNGNGSTGGSTDGQTGTKYYNNGNSLNPTFTLSANGYTKVNYVSSGKWAEGSAGGTQYSVGASRTLGEDTTYYACWVKAPVVYTFNSRVGLEYPGVGFAGMNVDCTGFAYADIKCRAYMGGMWNNLAGVATNEAYVGIGDASHLAYVVQAACGEGQGGEGGGAFTDNNTRLSNEYVKTINVSNLTGSQGVCGHAGHDGWGGGFISAGIEVYTVTMHN
jgi:hypothetical protein